MNLAVNLENCWDWLENWRKLRKRIKRQAAKMSF